MRCNGNCAYCNLCSVTIIQTEKPEPQVQIESVAETKEIPVVDEKGLVLAGSILPDTPEDNAGEFVVTKNIFGKEVVKKVK